MSDICYVYVKNKVETEGCEIAQFIVQALQEAEQYKNAPIKNNYMIS